MAMNSMSSIWHLERADVRNDAILCAFHLHYLTVNAFFSISHIDPQIAKSGSSKQRGPSHSIWRIGGQTRGAWVSQQRRSTKCAFASRQFAQIPWNTRSEGLSTHYIRHF
jgi:hypothetical protein